MKVAVDKKALVLIIGFLMVVNRLLAQDIQSDSAFKPSGKLWGYTFGDYYYKAYSDALNRGGANQYTGIEQGRSAFQIRRVYLGYNYIIHPKFSAELLLAAEDNKVNQDRITSGDLLSNNKLAFFIKYANVRWKNIWKGTDLVVGQMATPAFSLTVDPVWKYRSVERTLTDIRRTPSYDLGAALQGRFDADSNYGYNIMVGNGTGSRPESNKFKRFYGEVYAKLLDKRIVLDLYADYERLHWTPGFHHSRNIIKAFAAYTTPAFTIGAEAMSSYGRKDVVGISDNRSDTLNAPAKALSVFVHGNIIKDKLRYFARMDYYDPDTKYNPATYTAYKGFSANYEPNNKEQFITAGLDFTPIKNVHFMPNIWYNRYTSKQASAMGAAEQDYDLVYRITFYYVYGR